jgi:hypothetical protein
MFLTNRRALIAVLSATFAMIFMLFFDSMLSLRLKEMGVPENDIGFIFAGACFIYAVFSPVTGYLCKYIQRKCIT